ncbi:MAG: carboxypeptidase-like regulatory domain-containing protein [Bacteroides sp.]|nr:carboxypeptidase-like regulatory domain-containing protein [Bacteroides sp.]
MYAQDILQQTLRGIITDAASGHPIPYATVILMDNPDTGTTTDEEGKFILPGVPVGRHTLQASFMGYEPTIFREILVTSTKEVYLEIPLKESITELAEVYIRPQINKEKSLNTMALSGARMLSVEEASRYAGGMDDPARLASSFAGIAPSISNNGISVHGNAPHLLQWKMEDVEIPNPNHFADIATLGGGILSSLSRHVLGNFDFFTGAFPAEYGNAVSGVFDMRMRNGNNQKHEKIFQVGLLGIDVAAEGPLSKNKKASYLFNYRYSTTGLLGDLGVVNMGGTFKYQDLNLKLNFPTHKAGTFSVWSTSLIDNYQNDYKEDPEDWEFNSDRAKSNTKQYMASGGIGHRYFFSNDSYLKTTLATTFSRQNARQDIMDYAMNISPEIRMNTENTNLILNSYYNQKFNSRITARIGITYTKMFYDMTLGLSPYEGMAIETIARGKGNTDLISGYINTSTALNQVWTMNLGVYSQFLALNHKGAVEPRAGIKWQTTPRSSLAFSYGLHSRMEKIDVYFVKTPETGEKLVNKELDFTKAYHLMLSFSHKLSDNLHLKVEPYFQYLYDVPVIADSSYSVLNRDVFYVESALVNKGKGYNYGIDLTLERYLAGGTYYMFTGSFFNSRYQGGDGKWHNTKFNRNYILNVMGGKEWMMGRRKQDILSVNLKFTLQGGDRYSPVDEEATMLYPDKEVQYDESRAYSRQHSPMFISNLTVSYKMNRKKASYEIALKMLNVTGCPEYYGHEVNLRTGKIEPAKGTTSLPNLSYKIEF